MEIEMDEKILIAPDKASYCPCVDVHCIVPPDKEGGYWLRQ